MKRSKPDIKSVVDRKEKVSLLEPLFIPPNARSRGELNDLAMEIVQRATGFQRSIPPGMSESLAAVVRAMNCYYSNLIEGHNTHPVDIERALREDYSSDTGKRNLQHEARAHINVQAWIDAGGLAGRAATAQGIVETHRRFCELLPDDLLWAENPETGKRVRVIPGALREDDVRIGRHVPVSPGAVPRFLDRLEQAYATLGNLEAIIGVAAAHHRLLWIHPFTDGNGRVARLLSHALMAESLDTGGIWSIARGLARNVETYKQLLAGCDLPRRNDLDGRGNLSEEALAEFTRFFLKTCIDQVAFMEELVQPDRLRHRILAWAAEETAIGNLPQKSDQVLTALLYRGELPRGEIPHLLGVGDRQARRVVSALAGHGIITAKSSRAPIALAFPARLASRLLPGLFPETG